MAGPKQTARIFIPPRSAMQSGRGKAQGGKSQGWVLEFEPGERQLLDPLMGWAGSGDTSAQVRLHFPTRAEAIFYAEANALAYEVEEPKPIRIKAKVYADNFRFGRTDNWTH